ncbi:MAG: tetratricopeptide repeat protein [Candidatus Acidiferrales bacterium]
MKTLCMTLLIFVAAANGAHAASLRGALPRQNQTVPRASETPRFQAGLLALKENRLPDALEDFSRAERENPSDARVHDFLGIVDLQLGRYDDAAREYEEAIRLDPGFEDAYRNLGFLEWNRHSFEAAQSHLEKAIARNPGDAFAHYYLGRVLLDAGQPARAFDELNRSGMAWPGDPAFLLQAASGYLQLNRPKEARATLDRAAQLPLTPQQTARATSLYMTLRDADAAAGLLQKFLAKANSNYAPWAEFDLALAHLQGGEFQAAEKAALQFAAALPPDASPADAAGAHSIVGIAQARDKNAEASIQSLRAAVRLAPSSEECWLNLTLDLLQTSHHSDAITAAQQGLAALPKSYALHLRLGAAYLAAERYPESEKTFRELVDAGDPLPTSYLGLAQVLLRTGRAADAASELAAAEQKIGPNFLLFYFQGLALDRAGRSTDARLAYQRAVKLNPSNEEAHLGLARDELATGDASAAVGELQETLVLHPEDVQARRLLSQAYMKLSDKENAAKYATATEGTAPPQDENILGDFILPDWLAPPPAAETK